MKASRTAPVALYLAIGVTFCLLTCTNEPQVTVFPDPYVASVLGRGIHYMMAYDPLDPSVVDTTVFERSGRVIRYFGFGRLQRIVMYDSLNMIIRQLILNDIPGQYIYKYYLDSSGTLIQECRLLESLNWEIRKLDRGTHVRTIYFERNGLGQIIKETDTTSNQIFSYKYDRHGDLMARESSRQGQSTAGFISEYEYYEKHKIKTILHRVGDQKISMDFFSSKGVLDSTVYYDQGKRSNSILYRYLYY